MTLQQSKKFKNENSFEHEAIDYLIKTYGSNIECFKNSYNSFQFDKGRADYFFSFYGFFVACEFKNGKTKKQSHETLQDYRLKRISSSGGFAKKCRTMQDVIDFFNDIKSKIKK